MWVLLNVLDGLKIEMKVMVMVCDHDGRPGFFQGGILFWKKKDFRLGRVLSLISHQA